MLIDSMNSLGAKAFRNVSVVIAAMNETYSLRQTVERILGLCQRRDLAEILIVVCRRTTSECLEVAEDLQQRSTHDGSVPIRIYCQVKPFVGMAYREAFGIIRGSHVIMMSADLETPPEAVPRFIEEAKEHPDWIITASRWIGNASFDGYSRVKWFCNWFFQRMVGFLYHSGNTDFTYGYRIFPAELLRSINWQETKHPFFLETALVPLRLNTVIKEIPVSWKARTEGDSVNPFWANFKYFKTVLRILFTSKDTLQVHLP